MASRSEPALPVLVVAGSIVVVAVALRGRLPGAPQRERVRPADDPVATALVVGLLVLAIAVVAVAVVLRVRHHRVGHVAVTDRPDWLRGDLTRPSRRTVLIVAAVLAATVGAGVVLGGLGGGRTPNTPAPAPPATASSSAPSGPDAARLRRPESPHHDLVGYLAGATGLFLAVLTVGSVLIARRRDPARHPEFGAPAANSSSSATDRGTQTLARAAEVGLARVADHARDPRAAIIACYVAMEWELARVPEATPEDCDTASEVLARAVDRRVLGPDSATRLVDLFEEARFSSHVMTEAHRDVAAGVLRHVVDELRARA